MRQTGDILLISCYELGHQPLSLASPLGYLKSAGYPATALDAAVDKIPETAIRRARFIGLSVPMHTAMRVGMDITRHIRTINKEAYLCFYGLYASLNADYLLSHGAEAVISGEYEQPLLDLICTLESDAPIMVPGVRTLHHTSPPHLARQSFVKPDRSQLPELKRYAHLDTGNHTLLAGYTEATRGCLHTCLHCPITPIYQGRFFVVPRDIVLADIDQQVSLGARHITFGDPDFLNGPTHSLNVLHAMHEAHPDLTFDFTTKVEHILEHPAFFSEARTLGGLFVISAIESTSDLVLDRLVKGHTRMDIDRALEILGAADLPMRPSLVAFTPWTTLDGYLDMLIFIETHNLVDHIDSVQYTIRLLVPPGSALLNHEETFTWLGSLDEKAFTYQWHHPDSRMDRLHQDVSELVEKADETKEDPALTFYRIKQKASALREDALLPLPTVVPFSKRRRVPRLTEAWFC